MWPILLILAVSALVLAGGRRREEEEPGTGDVSEPGNGNGSPEPEPEPKSPGPAVPAGSIGTIKIDKTRIARNDSVRVEFPFTLDTRDAQGKAINWPTRIRTWLVHAQDNRVTKQTEDRSDTYPPGQHDRLTTLGVTPSDVWEGEKYRVDVAIEAVLSDDKGKPIPGSWKPLEFKSAPERITVVALSEADPGPEPEPAPEPNPPSEEPVADVDPPKPQPKEPTRAAKWKTGDRVVANDGKLGRIEAVKWGATGETWLYQMDDSDIWYSEGELSKAPPPAPSPEDALEQRKVQALCEFMGSLGSNPQVLVPPRLTLETARDVERYIINRDESLRREKAEAVKQLITRMRVPVTFEETGLGDDATDQQILHRALKIAGDRASRHFDTVGDRNRYLIGHSSPHPYRRQATDPIEDRYDSERTRLINSFERGVSSLTKVARAVIAQDFSTLSGLDLIMAAGPPQGVQPGAHAKTKLQAQLGC